MNLEKAFLILAVVFAVLALGLWYSGNIDGLFIAAVAGAVSYFLSIRFQVKARLHRRKAEAAAAADAEERI